MTQEQSNNDTFEILILYGSQTGNSEAAAIELGIIINEKLSRTNSNTKVTSTVMQCDDFLEIQKAKWTTRLFLIITSSYGVGHAPLGCHKFRLFCDDILDNDNDNDNDNALTGMKYALLGLGDSFYSTYLNNPTRIYKALTKAGAKDIVGDFGKADASGKGDDEQSKVIQRWMDSILPILTKEIEIIQKDNGHMTNDIILNATKYSQDICKRIVEDWDTTTTTTTASTSNNSIMILIVLLIAVTIGFILSSK